LRLKPYSCQQVIKVLGKLGFQAIRQRGSHIIFKGYYNGARRTVVVPNHSEIAVGTIRGILFQAGITVDEFVELANKT